MKRMYVTLGVILILIVWAVTSVAQKLTIDPMEDALGRHQQLRDEIHKRLRDKLLLGIGPDQDLFTDLESQMSFGSTHFETEWAESSEGRTLSIKPKDPKQQLDINVENGMISIKGKTETQNSVSSFSNSLSVPSDCEEAKVKMDQRDGKILVTFPYKQLSKIKVPRKENGPKPIKPSKDDITI